MRTNVAGTVLLMMTLGGAALAQVEAPKVEAPQVDAEKARDQAEKQVEEKTARPFDLMVGDKAPELAIDAWIKGAPVTGFEKGGVYVVEFWATWCGPCIQGMPHLSELQAKYADKGLRVVSVSSQDRRNSLEDVREMTAEKGDVMSYTVAWDNGRTTNERYLKAADWRTIPASFLVDQKGRVAFIGHPAGLDGPIEAVINGTWDIEKASADYLAKRKRDLEIDKLRKSISALTRDKDWDKVSAAYDKLIELEPRYATQRAMMLLTGPKDYARGYAALQDIVEGSAHDNPNSLNSISWQILTMKGLEKRDLKLALAAAERAADLTDREEASILDTLARAHYELGDLDRAIAVQREAISGSPGRGKADLQETLDKYLEENGG